MVAYWGKFINIIRRFNYYVFRASFMLSVGHRFYTSQKAKAVAVCLGKQQKYGKPQD